MGLVLRSATRATTAAIGRALGAAMEPLPRGGLVVVLLGDLGAGKTVLAGGIAAGLGVPPTSPVVSPTFTFARGYRGRVPMFHLDAYLVKSAADLEASGYEELGGEGRVTVVEWGDRIAEALPADRLEVTLRPDPTPSDRALPAAPGAPTPAPRAAGEPRPAGETAPEPPSGRVLAFVAGGPFARAVLERAHAALVAAATEVVP